MAELIYKDDLEKAVRESRANNYHKGFFAQAHDSEHFGFLGLISRQPVITEAEIKAKAIDEFAEKLRQEYENAISIPQIEIDFANKMIDRVIEQLKK